MKNRTKSEKWIAKSENSILPFGKWKGYKVGYIMDNDPDYILWLADEEIIEFSEELWKIVNAIEQDYRENFSPEWYWLDD